eukprot:15364992-Ditylum_brightwellii.AAC.1
MYCDFSLKFTVEEATKDIPYTIGMHQENSLPIPKFWYFPVAKSGNFRGRLCGQSIRIGKEFPFKKSLYMDDGSDGTYKDSKTEAMVFPPPGMDSSMFDMSPVPVFHISSICHILNINRMEVHMYGLSNEFLYEEFKIDPVDDIMDS